MKKKNQSLTRQIPICHLNKSDVLENPNVTEELKQSIKDKFPKDYFGLPIYSMPQNPSALVYRGRKAIEIADLSHASTAQPVESEKSELSSRRNFSGTHDLKVENFTAQRKVANALLTMVRNEQMSKHFLHSGGLDAALRLIHETKDREVIATCIRSLVQASQNFENGRHLLDKNVFGSIAVTSEIPDENIRHLTTIVLGNLSSCSNLEDLLVLNGILSVVQSMMAHVHRIDSISYLLLSLCNVGPALQGPDAELTIRICMQTTKKIDVSRYYVKALFVADIYSNFSRVSHFSSYLCEEGVLPLLLHIMETHPVDDILRKCTEALANLSMNRKNRREIASSGIAGRLTMIFEKGSPVTRSYALLIMGNLLSSGLFHDKVANVPTISNILDNMLDTNFPRQFTAVAYCICQLSKVVSSCEVMVRCAVVPIVLGYLRQAPQDAVDYLWTVLVNVSQHAVFFNDLVLEIGSLVHEIYEEVRFDASRLHQQQAVVQISLNISLRSELSQFLTAELIQLLVRSMKILFASRRGSEKIQLTALEMLTNLGFSCRGARSTILGDDLLELFLDQGLEHDEMNVQLVSLLNIISNEENCCYKLLDLGVQKLLVTLQDAFSRLVMGGNDPNGDKTRNSKMVKIGQSAQSLSPALLGAAEAAGLGGTGISHHHDSNPGSPTSGHSKRAHSSSGKFDGFQLGELGRSLSAAILHNIALKKPVLSPGVLMTLLALSKNTKTLRVLHCVRALTNMSVHKKSKVALSKEAKRILPLLTVIMRCGCEEAEKVQHYSAITTCNILAMPLDKDLLVYLAKSGAIVDLIVVTLLRTNVITTKESLGKAFFNLLAVGDLRELLIVQIDILAAVLEMSKIEYMDLLELSIRTIYNVSCELKSGSGYDETYSNKLAQLKVPRFMVSKLTYSPNTPGSISNQQIRLLLGMTIANMSHSKTLVVELTNEGEKLADALYRIFAINTEESTFCAVDCLFNISTIPECKVLANSKAVPLLVEVVRREGSIMCTKLAIACLCNMSMIPAFHDQMSGLAIEAVVNVVASPQFHMSVKKDAVQILYNMATLHIPARAVIIESDGVTALWKLLKTQSGGAAAAEAEAAHEASGTATAQELVQDSASTFSVSTNPEEDEAILIVISHIVRELSVDIHDAKIEKKLMGDGIMNIILKLCKIELPVVKLDMSYCMHNMAKAADLMKVLKWDSVDVIFWLLLHDTLGMHDLIMKNCARALRCFSFSPDVAKALVKQERFFSVLRAIIKSKSEDVLWQTAGVLYNLMQMENCLKILLNGGLVSFIFDIAASGYESVKHVCSACLHMVPDNMPNMEDPLVLELVLALLEAEGDKFAELGEKPLESLPYSMVPPCHAGSDFKIQWTGFSAVWTSLTCQVDNIFTPSMLAVPVETGINFASVAAMDSSTISESASHAKILSAQYNHFVHRTASQTNVYENSYLKFKPAEGETEQGAAAAAASSVETPDADMSQLRVATPELPTVYPPAPVSGKAPHQHEQLQQHQQDRREEEMGRRNQRDQRNQLLSEEILGKKSKHPFASDAMSQLSEDHDQDHDFDDNASRGSGVRSIQQLVHDIRRQEKGHKDQPGNHQTAAAGIGRAANSLSLSHPLTTTSSSRPPSSLPLIRPPRSLPLDTVSAINDSIRKSGAAGTSSGGKAGGRVGVTFSNAGAAGALEGRGGGRGVDGARSLDGPLLLGRGKDKGKGRTSGRAGERDGGDGDGGLVGRKGLSKSLLSASQTSLAAFSVNAHGNDV